MPKKVKYRCWYSGKQTNLAELKRVDKKLKSLSKEELEELYDLLGKSKRPRKEPYVHTPAELGYPVLNICIETLNKALNKMKG